MQRYKEVGIVLAGNRHPFGQGKECIGIARQKRLDAGFAVQPFREFLRKGQSDDLFLGPRRAAGGAGIDAAMTGIDRDDKFRRTRCLVVRRDRGSRHRGGRLPLLILHQAPRTCPWW